VWLNLQRTRIHFIDSEIDEVLRAELDSLNVERPLFVVDRAGLAAEIFEEALFGGCAHAVDTNERMRIVHLAEDDGNLETIASIARVLSRRGHDCLILVGERALIDAGKFALRDVIRRRAQTKRHPSAPSRLPLIVIPTGPGDGAGLRRWTRIKDASGIFRSIHDESFEPDILICDARLGKNLGPEAAICAEFDGVVHCIETLVRPRLTPPAKGLALDCLRQTWGHLRNRSGDDGRAMSGNAEISRSVIAAMSENGGLGAAHSMALCLEEMQCLRFPHGYFHAAVLGPVLRFNAPAITSAIAGIEEAMGCIGGAAGIAATVAETAALLGLPTNLTDIGLGEAGVSLIADAVAEDPGSMTNPRRASKADYQAMLREIA
jgi:alcohol dehydrogenase class IV